MMQFLFVYLRIYSRFFVTEILHGKPVELVSNITLVNKLIQNKLISISQSGFKSDDSCMNQLLSIIHEIYSCFDKNLEVSRVFLDISASFEKVRYNDIIFKLTQNGISGNVLNL